MKASNHAGDHSPLLSFEGPEDCAALEQLFFHMEDETGWLPMLRQLLADGGSFVIERCGDWVLFPPS